MSKVGRRAAYGTAPIGPEASRTPGGATLFSHAPRASHQRDCTRCSAMARQERPGGRADGLSSGARSRRPQAIEMKTALRATRCAKDGDAVGRHPPPPALLLIGSAAAAARGADKKMASGREERPPRLPPP